MVLFSLAGAAAATGAAQHAFSYNREAWLTDVQVNQQRLYQKQQVQLSQADMFREDIRELVSHQVRFLNDFVVVATLLLAGISSAYTQSPLPEGSAEFMLGVYQLCLGSALIYMALSVLCAIWAQQLAVVCQKELLTTLVRLPVEEFEAEIEAAAEQETAKAFEDQGLGTLFRVPGLSRLAGVAPAAAEPPRMRESGFVAAGGGRLSQAQRRHSAHHLAAYYAREQEWQVLVQYSFIFGVFGLGHCMQAFGYYKTGQYYAGCVVASLITHAIMVSLDLALTQGYMQHEWPLALLSSTTIVGGPVAAVAAVRLFQAREDQVAVPLTFGFHLVRTVINCIQLLRVQTAGVAEAPSAATPARLSGEDDGSQSGDSCESGGSSDGSETSGSGAPLLAAKGTSFTREDRRWLVLLGGGVVAVAWLVTFCWAVRLGCLGRADNGVAPSLGRQPFEAPLAAAGV